MKSNRGLGKKLLYFLSSDDGTNLSGFSDWLASPLLGNSPQSLAILELIEQEVLDKGLTVIPPELLAELIQPDRPLNANKLKYMGMRITNLQQKLMDFLAFQAYQAQGSQVLYQLQGCLQLKRDQYIPGMYGKAQQRLGSLKTTRDFEDTFQLECLMNNHLARNATSPGSSHLVELEEAMDHYFILQKLKYGCAVLNEQILGGPARLPRLTEGILAEVSAQPAAFPGLIRAYYHTYQLLLGSLGHPTTGDAHFSEFMEVFTQLISHGTTEARDLFTHVQNHLILQVRAEKQGFREAIADFYMRSLESGVLEEGAHLSPTLYKNCVEILCKFALYAEAERVAKEFKDKIYQKGREAAFSYNRAVIHLFQGNSAAAARELYPLLGDLHSLNYGLGARVYLCRALWENGEYERLQESLHAFSQYLLRNKKKLGVQVGRYRKFVSYLRRMNGIAMGPEGGQRDGYAGLLVEIEAQERDEVFGWLRGRLGVEG